MRAGFNVVLTTYETLMGVDMPLLSSIRWHHLIIDEGHRLKNSKCKLNAVLKEYNTQHRLLLTGVLYAFDGPAKIQMITVAAAEWESHMRLAVLTGTPVQNQLEELWSLLHFLMPTLFTSSEDFQQWFGEGQGRGGSSALNEEEMLLVTNRLHQVLRPFMLRRMKETVATELPGKVSVFSNIMLSIWGRCL